MIQTNKLTLKDTSLILAGISPVTVTRISKSDSTFPTIEKIGRSIFIDSESLYKWLSRKSGLKVSEPDTALTSKDLQKLFNKSHTWVWQSEKSGLLPKPFYIGRSKFWMNSQIVALFEQEVA